MATINPNDEDNFYLEIKRNSLSSQEDKLKTLIKEICLYDSVHDFDNIFYDKIPRAKTIDTTYYGVNQPNILSNINFTYVNDILNPIDLQENFNIMCQQNNRVSGGSLGILNAFYTKSGKPNIENYYLEQVKKILGSDLEIISIDRDTDNDDAYATIVDKLKGYAQLENNSDSYIPIVIDVQKRLLKIMREESKKSENGNIKLAYVCNREMTNDAAGKINFKEPVKRTGLNFIVDVDEEDIVYRNSKYINLGFDNIKFSQLYNTTIPGVRNNEMTADTKIQSKLRKPWCQISFPNSSYDYQAILNDSTLNSKGNAGRIVNSQARNKVKDLIGIQENSDDLKLVGGNFADGSKFRDSYKIETSKKIIEFKNKNSDLKKYSEIIFFLFLRKRIGDQLQALSCLKKRKYALLDFDAAGNILKIKVEEQKNPFIFVSYDIIAIAFAVANKIPCIFEKSDKSLELLIPKTQTVLPVQTQLGGSFFNSISYAFSGVRALVSKLTREESFSLRNTEFTFESFNEYLISNPIVIVKLLEKHTNKVTKDLSTFVRQEYYIEDNGILSIFPFTINEDSDLINVLTTKTNIDNISYNPIISTKGETTTLKIIDVDKLIIQITIKNRKVVKIFYDNRVAGEDLGPVLFGIFNFIFKEDLEDNREIIELIYSLLDEESQIMIDNELYNLNGGSYKQKSKRQNSSSNISLKKDLFLKLLENENFVKSENKNLVSVMNYLFHKILNIYENKLIFEEEIYDSKYNKTSFPNYVYDKEVHSLLEILKDNSMNIFEIINFLTKIRETNSFAYELLYNLGDMCDLVFDSENHELINIISKHKLEYSKIHENILAKIVEVNDSPKNFDSNYFSESLSNSLKQLSSLAKSVRQNTLSLTTIKSKKKSSEKRLTSRFNSVINSRFNLGTSLSKTFQPAAITAYGKKKLKKTQTAKKRKKRIPKRKSKKNKK